MRSQIYLHLKELLYAMIVILPIHTIAFAQNPGPSIEILTPTANSCVPNRNLNQLGPQPGQPANFTVSPVGLNLRISEPTAAEVTISALLNGAPIVLNQNTFTPVAPNTAEETTIFQIPAEAIADGVNHVLEITASSNAGQNTAIVTFSLDRAPPALSFTAQEIAALNQCSSASALDFAQISPTAQDTYDNSPSIQISDAVIGCLVKKTITARDHCGAGNAQIVDIQTKQPALDPPVIEFYGVQEGDKTLLADVSFGAIAPPSCLDSIEASVIKDQGNAQFINNGTQISEPGAYTVTVSAANCSQTSVQKSISFTVLPQPFANAGGPYQANQGQTITLDGRASFAPAELGGITEYAWDFDLADNSNGYDHFGSTVEFTALENKVYSIALKITTATGEVRYDFSTVSVGDLNPNCVLAGPYQAAQGELLTLDASGSTPGDISEPILAYEWSFGDGNSLFIVNNKAQHRFNRDGTFVVTMTARDIDSSCSATTTVTIRDVIPVVSGLMLLNEAPILEGDSLIFSSGSTSAGSSAEPILSFFWDFGDQTPIQTSQGNIELRSPAHTYVDQGNYQVCLTVNDGDSPASGCLPISVVDLSPVARISGPDFGIEGEMITLSALGSHAGGNADPLTKYIWDFGDGSPKVEVQQLDQVEISHIFQTNGNLIVTLEVQDEDSSTMTQFPIYIDDVSPFAVLNQTGAIPAEGVQTTWSARNSEPGAPTDLISFYRWDFGDGTVIEGADQAEVTHTWADNGFYELTLTVFDEDGSASTISRFINVLNLAPQNARIVTSSDQIDLNESLRFEVFFDDVPADTVSIRWRMGEGTTFSNRRVVTHSYREINIFTVRVELQDEDGGITTVQKDIQVNPAGPKFVVSNLSTVKEGQILSFDVNILSALNGRGQIDGPVTYRITRRPANLQWEEIPTANATNEIHLRMHWQTSSTDAGTYPFKIQAISLAGIERSLNITLQVEEGMKNILAAVGGNINQSNITFYQYESLAQSRGSDFSATTSDLLGMGFGKLLQKTSVNQVYPNLPKDQLWVSSPQDASVHIFDLDAPNPKKIRKIKVDGHPFALAESKSLNDNGLIWIFDVWSSQVNIIDQKLKPYRKSNIPFTKGVYDALPLSYMTQDGTKTAFLLSQREGVVRLIKGEAVLNNQGDRSFLADLSLPRADKAAQLILQEERNEVWVLQDRLLQAYDLNHIKESISQLEQDPNFNAFELKWQVRLAFAPQKIKLLAGETPQIWAASPQGLRIYEIPMDLSGINEEIPLFKGDILSTNRYQDFDFLDQTIIGENAVVVATERTVENLNLSLQSISADSGLNIQKILGISLKP
jgi:PKD repeat protein